MLTSIALASIVVSSTCSWDNPGQNRFVGNVAAAVQTYTDISIEERNALQRRLENREYDEIVEITRDGIRGAEEYTDLRQMFFGQNNRCESVTREKWAAGKKEYGFVYCEKQNCLLVPFICSNLSRVTKVQRPPAQPPGDEGGGGSGGGGIVGPGIIPVLPLYQEPSFESVVIPNPVSILVEPENSAVRPRDFAPIFAAPFPPGREIYVLPIIPIVPEPSTFVSMILGFLGIVGYKKFRTRNKDL